MGEVSFLRHREIFKWSINGETIGLQCHTAPFSWKLVFEGDHQLYELIMTACSSKEEVEWRERLCRQIGQEPDARDPNLYNSLSLNMKSLGTVFGRPGRPFRFKDAEILCSLTYRYHCSQNIYPSGYNGWPKVTFVPGRFEEYEHRCQSCPVANKYKPITISPDNELKNSSVGTSSK